MATRIKRGLLGVVSSDREGKRPRRRHRVASSYSGGKTKREARYTGGELDLRRHVEMVRNARGSEGKSSDARSKDVRSEVLELAMQLGEKCGATVRLHNYPAVENDVGVDQRKIATSVMTRSKYRYKAKKFLVKYIESYLGHTTKPDVSACEGLSTRIELVKEDPNDVTEAQASALLKEMEIKREQIEHERVSAEKIAASEKDAEFTDQPGRGATLEVPEETAKAAEDSEAEGRRGHLPREVPANLAWECPARRRRIWREKRAS